MWKVFDDVQSFDREEGVAGEGEAGMVVEVVEDLDTGCIGELPVGEVALPHFVGQIGLEAKERALGALLRLRSDLSVALEDAPDGGDGGSVGACQ